MSGNIFVLFSLLLGTLCGSKAMVGSCPPSQRWWPHFLQNLPNPDPVYRTCFCVVHLVLFFSLEACRILFFAPGLLKCHHDLCPQATLWAVSMHMCFHVLGLSRTWMLPGLPSWGEGGPSSSLTCFPPFPRFSWEPLVLGHCVLYRRPLIVLFSVFQLFCLFTQLYGRFHLLSQTLF